jgi:hypothetical protein
MALKAVVTTMASSATMQDAIETSANTQDLFAFSFCSIMAISSWLQFNGPRHEDEPFRPKDSAMGNFCSRESFRVFGTSSVVRSKLAANGEPDETDRGQLPDEAQIGGR